MAQGVNATQVFEMLMESQYWHEDQMQDYQRTQLEQLLHHAYKTVPFYAERLAPMFDTRGQINWDRWQDVPVFGRAEASLNNDALRSTAHPRHHGRTDKTSTSGTTGNPVQVEWSLLTSTVNLACDWRAHTWWSLDWSQVLVRWRKMQIPQSLPESLHNHGPWGPRSITAAMAGQQYFADASRPFEELLQHLRKVSAVYMTAPASMPFEAAQHLLEQQQHIPIKRIIGYGFAFEPEFAPAISNAFGAKLANLYSSTEGGRMAYTCGDHRHYHVNAETVLVEILDDENRPCPVGVTGRVVITALQNAAQPFIRYDHGDLASWAEGCPCGRRLPTIKSIDGRSYHMFRRRDGKRFAPAVPDHSRAVLGAEFWQFSQTSLDTIEVKYKPTTARNAEAEQQFTEMLRGFLQEDFQIVFVEVSQLPKTASGKFLKYQNLMDHG